MQKIADFDEICQEIERETERVTGNNKVCWNFNTSSIMAIVTMPF